MSFFHSDSGKVFKAILIGMIAAIAIILLLTCVFGFALKMTSGIPYGVIDYVMIGIEAAGVLSGAYIAALIAKCRGLVIGASCAAAALLILFACGLSIRQNDIGILTVIKSAAVLLCGVIGGILGVNRKERIRIK